MAAKARTNAKAGGKIRLGCLNCDAAHDGIAAAELESLVRAGWSGVWRVRSYAEATKTYYRPEDEPPGYSALDRETHLGVCPDCADDESAAEGE